MAWLMVLSHQHSNLFVGVPILWFWGRSGHQRAMRISPTALPLHMTWVNDLGSMPGGWDDIPDSRVSEMAWITVPSRLNSNIYD